MANVKQTGITHPFPHELGIREIEMDEEEVARRKEFLEFGDPDVQVLKSLRNVADKHADSVIEELYRHFLSFEETRSFFRDPAVLDRVKRMQKEYFLRLTEGDYGAGYVANRLRIGTAHERIKLSPKWYLGAYSFYLQSVAERLLEDFDRDSAKALSAFLSLMKLVFLDVELAVETYVHARESTMRKHQEEIRELSTPVLRIRERLLLLPIIGVIDTHRARLITDTLLRFISTHRAKVIVMDVTGVATIDTRVANHLIQTVTAAGLMGASVIVTGLSSDVAQALVALGVDLEKLNTVGDLQGGIEEAERILGYRVIGSSDRGGDARPA